MKEKTNEQKEFETMCVLFRGIIAERYKGEELERALDEFDADMREVERLMREVEKYTDKWAERLEECITRELEFTLQPQEGITEEDVQVTRDFLEEKGLLTDSTEDNEQQDSEPTERKGSDIVRECREAIENAFSDMIWNLCDHPVRPSVAIEAHKEKCRLLEVLTRFEAAYKEMEGEL